MNWVDFVIVIIIALTTFSSLRAGLIRQAMTLIGLVVGVYMALGYHQQLALRLSSIIDNPTLAKAAAFILILIVAWIAAAFLAGLIRSILNSLGLGWTDNAMGMFVGFLVGLVIAVGVVLLLTRLPIASLNQAVLDSSLAYYIFLVLPYLRQLLPSNLRILTTL